MTINNTPSWVISLLGLAIVAVPILLLIIGFHNMTKHEQTVTVEEKWIKSSGDSGQTYLLGTTGGVLSIKDNLVFGQFRSSDLYFRIKEGETYCFKLSGVRFGLFSMYPNVYGFCD